MINLTINGKKHELDVPADLPLLWALRDVVKLTGTKFGCGISMCGACTVHVDGQVTRACVTPVASAAGKSVTTIEAIEADPVGKQVQEAWLDLGVAQCGFCQGGQIMTATGLLKQNANPSDEQIDEAMSGNLCRCGTYTRIRQAIHRVAGAGEDQV
ncbi:(2Fe-2S)-binding protein [Allohahella sp. A8]|uniref:(2Fe-2S)-binding protein n=1 Tax=Allohahella sp. A8 TaxID=3141461 RepID=UPI003A7F721A